MFPKLSKEEQIRIIQDCKFYPHMQMFFAFLGGLIEDKEFLLREIESEPKDLVGFYEFELILICIREIRMVSNDRRNKVFKLFIYWLAFVIKYKLDYDIVIDKLKFLSIYF